MPSLAYTRSGAGAPLVLLHGIGSSRHAWGPVVPALAAHFTVIAVDLPGFGDSRPGPAHIEPTPAALAAAVAQLLDDLGLTSPHLAGNSLGGWVALELAAIRPAASLTLLSPAGLWHGDAPLYNRVSLRGSRWLTRHEAPRKCPQNRNSRRRKTFLVGDLGHVEKWEKHWRLLSALNKLRISGDIAQFRGDFAQAGGRLVGTTGRSSSPSYGASRCLASYGSEACIA